MRYLIILLFCCFTQLSKTQTSNLNISLKDLADKSFYDKRNMSIQPLPDGESYAQLNNGGTKIIKYAYKTGKEIEVLFDVANTRETQLKSIEGYKISSSGYHIVVWNDSKILQRNSFEANVYHYDTRRNLLKPLSDNSGKLSIPTFSPDGRMCAFVRDNNIWLKKFDFDTESQVTKDGSIGKIINGATNWLYDDEFGVTNLMAWSPDSKILAFVKFDENNVGNFTFQNFDGTFSPAITSFKYTTAGQSNAIVTCHAYNIESKDIKKMEVPLENNGYIPMIKFTTNPDQLAVMTLNRNQNDFRMHYANPKSGLAKLILQEENKYYVDFNLLKHINFTPDNFIYLSEKDGFTHIYLYSPTGVLQKQLTNGNWDVTDSYGIDAANSCVYYQSAEESPLKRSIYKVDFKGSKTKLSEKQGTNSAEFSSTFKYFVNQYSNTTTPTITSINESNKGKELVSLEDNQSLKNKLSGMHIPTKEFFTFKNASGIDLNGWMIKPSGFSPSNSYPVVMMQYNAPKSQKVLDKFEFGWEYYLASKGYIVVCIDGRGTGARGEEFAKCTYMKLGQLEADDQIAGANYLTSQPYVNKNKIAIYGASYGGFTTLMTMSKSKIFKAGIAIAPITDWKYFNSIYTEKYMRTPQENAMGYNQSSVIQSANRLEGNLLITHGTSDDKVHYLNTLYYSKALEDAEKLFEMQIYPGKNHYISDKATRLHLFKTMSEFLDHQLK